MTVEEIDALSWEELGARYLKGKRTVLRWAADGAPVRRPGEMQRWWSENRSNKCPAGILRFAAECGRQAPVEEAPGEERPVRFELAADVGDGYAGMLREAEAWRALCYEQLVAAGRQGDEGAIEKWKARWEKAGEQVRKLMKDAARIRIEEGQAWDIREAQEEARLVLRQMDTDLKAMCRRVWPKLKEAKDDKAREAVWRDALDGVKRGWEQTRFAGLEAMEVPA